MAPLPSAEGLRINWINYKTGEQHISFRMDADNHQATVAIVLSHPDAGIRQLYFEQFAELKRLLHEALQEEWEWEPQAAGPGGKDISRIGCRLGKVNIFNREDWPALISFFKPRIMALDEFWSSAKYAFEALR